MRSLLAPDGGRTRGAPAGAVAVGRARRADHTHAPPRRSFCLYTAAGMAMQGNNERRGVGLVLATAALNCRSGHTTTVRKFSSSGSSPFTCIVHLLLRTAIAYSPWFIPWLVIGRPWHIGGRSSAGTAGEHAYGTPIETESTRLGGFIDSSISSVHRLHRSQRLRRPHSTDALPLSTTARAGAASTTENARQAPV